MRLSDQAALLDARLDEATPKLRWLNVRRIASR
jgi:hypothetical protein